MGCAQGGACLPLDATFSAVTPGWNIPPIARGAIHFTGRVPSTLSSTSVSVDPVSSARRALFCLRVACRSQLLGGSGRVFLYSLPSVAILSLFRTSNASRPRTVPVPGRDWRHRVRTSATEALLRVSPSGLDLAAEFADARARENSNGSSDDVEDGGDRLGDDAAGDGAGGNVD